MIDLCFSPFQNWESFTLKQHEATTWGPGAVWRGFTKSLRRIWSFCPPGELVPEATRSPWGYPQNQLSSIKNLHKGI